MLMSSEPMEEKVKLEPPNSDDDDKKDEQNVKPVEKAHPSPSKRRFLLVSRQIVTSNIPRRTQLKNIKSEKDPKMTAHASTVKLPIRISHRLCQVCHTIRPVSDICMITDEIEKLFLLLFGISRKMIMVDVSIRYYRQPMMYTCRSHFPETSSEILNMFGVASAAGIFRSRKRKVAQVVRLVNHLSGKLTEESRLLNFAYLFIIQYPEATAVIGPMVKSEDIPFENTIECQTADLSNGIVPKCFRQPRKQRLEKEDEGSSMLRVIKQESLHLPTQPVSGSGTMLQNGIKCCYCLEVRSKQHMLNIPKTPYRLTRWRDRLGDGFGDRLLSECFIYMCRSHFSQEDLSTRGRLRKAAIPNVIPPPEIHTFKKQGDDFVKVSVEELEEKEIRVDDTEEKLA